uniref:Uncharacterized protein n=1 Tax=Cacopsylla melanoneura TaxID=428564 RepID=A0A8D8XDI4_9HEMI
MAETSVEYSRNPLADHHHANYKKVNRYPFADKNSNKIVSPHKFRKRKRLSQVVDKLTTQISNTGTPLNNNVHLYNNNNNNNNNNYNNQNQFNNNNGQNDNNYNNAQNNQSNNNNAQNQYNNKYNNNNNDKFHPVNNPTLFRHSSDFIRTSQEVLCTENIIIKKNIQKNPNAEN